MSINEFNEKRFNRKVSEYIEKNLNKEVILNGKKYKSLVTLDTLNELYEKVYNLLIDRFDKRIINEKLEIKEEKNFHNIASVILNVSHNIYYRFLPLDDESRNILYTRCIYMSENFVNQNEFLNSSKEMFFKIDDIENEFKKEISLLKETTIFEIKENTFEGRIYLKAMEHYNSVICNKNLNTFLEQNYVNNNLFAAEKYINELLKYDIEDKNFLSNIYLQKYNINIMKDNKIYNLYLKKAMIENPLNQNVMVTSFQILVTILKSGLKNDALNIVLNYLYNNIDNLFIDEESIFNNYISLIFDFSIINYFKNKKIKADILDKTIYIYESILKRIDSSREAEIKFLNELLFKLKRYK